MFEDEDIGIHVAATAAASSQQPAAAAAASSRSDEPIDLTITKAPSRRDIRWALFPSASRTAAFSSSSASSSSSSSLAAFSVSNMPKRSRLSLTEAPSSRAEARGAGEVLQTRAASPPRSAPLPRGKRGNAARHVIPHSPHCRVLPSNINRRFVCVYRTRPGRESGQAGEEKQADEGEIDDVEEEGGRGGAAARLEARRGARCSGGRGERGVRSGLRHTSGVRESHPHAPHAREAAMRRCRLPVRQLRPAEPHQA